MFWLTFLILLFGIQGIAYGEVQELNLYVVSNYLDIVEAGSKVHDVLPELSLKDYQNREITLFKKGSRSLVVFGSAGCADCKKFYPLLKDWAWRYESELKIIIVYTGHVSKREVEELDMAGIEVVMDSKELRQYLNPGNLYYSFLINELGEITYRFKFELCRWYKYDQIIEEFVKKKKIPIDFNRRSFKIGQPLNLPETLIDLEESRGKPIVILLEKPVRSLNLTHKFLQRLHQKFAGQVDTILIVQQDSSKINQIVKEYYSRYNIKDSTENFETYQNIDGNFNDIPAETKIIFDEEGLLFEFFPTFLTPIIIITDADLKPVEVFYLSTANCCGSSGQKVEEVLFTILSDLLEKK